MKKKKDYDSYDRIVKKLKELFDAVPDESRLTKVEEEFLDKRNEFEQNEDVWYLSGYTHHYEELKKYGLDEVIMKELVVEIEWYLKNRRGEYLKSEFYKRFKDHPIVSETMKEYSQLSKEK